MAKRQQKRRTAKEPPPKPSRRRLLTGAAALVGASGLLATVTGLLVTRSADPLSDSAADVVGSSALVAYDDAGDALNGTTFAVDHVLPAAVLTGPAESSAVSARLVREGAVRVGSGATAVTIENTRKETVVITSIRATVRQRTAPPAATLIVVESSGGPSEGPVRLHFDLDGVDLDARSVDDGGKWGGKYLDEHGLTLAAAEKLRFTLIGHTRSDLVDWVVEVGYLVNGKVRTLELAPKGRPMRVTGASASYREAFTWTTAGLTRKPLTKFCPTDCRKQIIGGSAN